MRKFYSNYKNRNVNKDIGNTEFVHNRDNFPQKL